METVSVIISFGFALAFAIAAFIAAVAPGITREGYRNIVLFFGFVFILLLVAMAAAGGGLGFMITSIATSVLVGSVVAFGPRPAFARAKPDMATATVMMTETNA